MSTSVFPETFGLAPLEAAAAGLPVIAFGVAGMEEHVCDGVTAVVPRAPTPDALAKAMTGLLDDAGRARELGRNGAAAAATHFGAAGAASRAALFIRRAFDAFSGEFFPSFPLPFRAVLCRRPRRGVRRHPQERQRVGPLPRPTTTVAGLRRPLLPRRRLGLALRAPVPPLLAPTGRETRTV